MSNLTSLHILVITDITELRMLQHHKRRDQMLTELGQAITAINHEMQNILTPVDHYLNKARKYSQGSQEVTSALDRATERLKMLHSLTNELRQYYKAPEITLRRIRLLDIINSVLNDLSVTLPGWQPPALHSLDYELSVDLQKFRQVLLNVLKNAWEAMENEDDKKWSVDASVDGNGGLQVKICDNGKGIPEAQLEQIFEPFFSLKSEKGTGLGLAICRRIMESHGGSINAGYTADNSTSVILSLPEDKYFPGAVHAQKH